MPCTPADVKAKIADIDRTLLRHRMGGVGATLVQVGGGIDHFFETRQPVPMPSAPEKGQYSVALPVTTVAKVLLHNEMLLQGIKKAELARRLDIVSPSVERIFNVRHKTRIETLEAAFKSIGRNMEISMA